MKQSGVPYWYDKTEITDVIVRNGVHRVKSEIQFTLETLFDLFPTTEPDQWLFAKDIMQDYDFLMMTKKVPVSLKSVTQALKGLGVQHKDVQRVAAFRMARRAVGEVQPLIGRHDDDFLR
jgi:beta-N-acetylglucosaminidase